MRGMGSGRFGLRFKMAMRNKERHAAKLRSEEQQRASAPSDPDTACEDCEAQPFSSSKLMCCDSKVCEGCYKFSMDSGVCRICGTDPRYARADSGEWYDVIERPGRDPLFIPLNPSQGAPRTPSGDDRVGVCAIASCGDAVPMRGYGDHLRECHANAFVGQLPPAKGGGRTALTPVRLPASQPSREVIEISDSE